MVTIDLSKCTSCGICMKRFEDYCISNFDGKPVIDYQLCNQCQKCISICPSRAILMNGIEPDIIENPPKMNPSDMEEFLAHRRSVKKFLNKIIPKDIIESIARASSYAPNQNKNLSLLVIDDNELIEFIDNRALKQVGMWYKIFTFKPFMVLASILSLSGQLSVIKKKMEFDLIKRRHIVKDNTQVLIMVAGDPGVAVTEASAPFLLASMIYSSESFGVGNTLMDSIKMTINLDGKIKRKLNIPRNFKIFGVLALGYSDEKIINIPRGYKVSAYWNSFPK